MNASVFLDNGKKFFRLAMAIGGHSHQVPEEYVTHFMDHVVHVGCVKGTDNSGTVVGEFDGRLSYSIGSGVKGNACPDRFSYLVGNLQTVSAWPVFHPYVLIPFGDDDVGEVFKQLVVELLHAMPAYPQVLNL